MKRKILSFITATAMTVSALAVQNLTACAVTDTETTETIKIMPIGDSITHGYQSSGGYRKYFCYWFGRDGEYDFDMVGPNADYPDTFEYNGKTITYDTNHCGYSGYAIQYMTGTETRQGILETLQDGNYLQTYDPDIIMLQIGTNDILSAYNDCITDRLENLINYIDENTNDNAVIFVSTIPDIDVSVVYDWFWSYGDEKYNNTLEDFSDIIQGYIDSYNSSIPVLVEKLQNEGKNIEFADIHSVVDKDTQLNDGVHPNESGYEAMGSYWSGRILAYLNNDDDSKNTTTTTTETTTTTTTTTETTTTTTETTSTTSTETTTTETTTNTTETTTTTTTTTDAEKEIPYRIADLVSLSNYVLGRENHGITEENALTYDINGDGVLDSFDIALLRREYLISYANEQAELLSSEAQKSVVEMIKTTK